MYLHLPGDSSDSQMVKKLTVGDYTWKQIITGTMWPDDSGGTGGLALGAPEYLNNGS